MTETMSEIDSNKTPATQELQFETEEGVVKSFDNKGDKMKGKSLKIVFAIFLVVVLGVFSGYGLNKTIGQGGGGVQLEGKPGEEGSTSIKKGLVVGSKDESTFKDSAEGELNDGGIDGEGSHHLVRPGGDSQNVYLTSSILDLDIYSGKKVKVWGETFAAQKAGWLMDVGRLEVLE